MSKAANGHFKLTVYLRPDQYGWLHALALEEVMKDGGGRPDVSRILRAMVDKLQPDIDKLREKDLKKRRK